MLESDVCMFAIQADSEYTNSSLNEYHDEITI